MPASSCRLARVPSSAPPQRHPDAIVTALLPLTACPDCDLLQRLPVIRVHEQALCPRCGAILVRPPGRSSTHIRALAITAAIFFLMANATPIVTFDNQGMQISATLIGAVTLLWQSGMNFIALLVLTTTVLGPGAELALLLIVLNQRIPSARALRWLTLLRPWAMIDVLVLGVIVSVKKLADMAIIIPGPALWALCVLMFLVTAIRSGDALTRLWTRVTYPGRLHVS